jgi:hypothetical protein
MDLRRCPPNAIVAYQGIDPEIGPLSKYALLKKNPDAGDTP